MEQVSVAKPPYASPCTRCGYCCAMERCWLSIQAFGEGPGPCPALEQHDGLAACGVLLKAPASVQPTIAYVLRIGGGCDSPDDAESEAWNRRHSSANSVTTGDSK